MSCQHAVIVIVTWLRALGWAFLLARTAWAGRRPRQVRRSLDDLDYWDWDQAIMDLVPYQGDDQQDPHI